jgi:Concanavalin A-like lectin/glucanases superfamily
MHNTPRGKGFTGSRRTWINCRLGWNPDPQLRSFALSICSLATSVSILLAAPSGAIQSEVWTFDHLNKVGGLPTTIIGHPHLIKAPVGKAVQFDGVGDALFIGENPLAGADAFTFEVIFRPERGGAEEQRWFDISELDPKTGADEVHDRENRYLFEIRVIGDQWCLESLVRTPTGGKQLIDRQLLHPLDVWHHVAMVYDRNEFRSYINGVLEGKEAAHFEPIGPGHTSVGVRINKVYYFKGSVEEARFTRRALAPEEFLKLPPQPMKGQ